MKKLNHRICIRLSELCFAISSASFLFIPKSNFNGNNSQRTLAYMVGILFWLGLIAGAICLVIMNTKRRKAHFKKYSFPGALCFFKNKKAKICDFAMILSVPAFILSNQTFGLYHTLSLVFLALSVLLIYLHSILNGNNYAYAFQKGV